METNTSAEKKAPGKSLLKVTGILFIIFGAITALISLLAIVGSVAIAGGALEGAGIDAATGAEAMSASVLLLVTAVLNIVVGILGVLFCEKTDKAIVCLIAGLVLIVLQVVSAVTGGFSVATIIGLILPVLYSLGAWQNKSAG